MQARGCRAKAALAVTRLPPIDTHAHIDPGVDPRELEKLHAVVFAVTRSLAESQQALPRTDPWTIWGVGCHPGLARAQRAFCAEEFAARLSRTPLAGEIGLDGRSRVPLAKQRWTFRAALEVLSEMPRFTTIHTYLSTGVALEELEKMPTLVPVLHWWLGSLEETKRAVGLGCYFSINPSCVGRGDILSAIPPERVLTETDHPFGDKRIRGSVPGHVEQVELELARHYGIAQGEMRRQVWRNLLRVVQVTGTARLYAPPVRTLLASLPS